MLNAIGIKKCFKFSSYKTRSIFYHDVSGNLNLAKIVLISSITAFDVEDDG